MKLLKSKKGKKDPGKKSTNVELGSLYDINKSIIENNIATLTREELEDKIALVVNFIAQQKNTYYMLLCNDRKDYTVFRLNIPQDGIEAAHILIDECLTNRGQVKSIELTKTNDAIEIWLSIDKESYCYYFFPYDLGIIEC